MSDKTKLHFCELFLAVPFLVLNKKNWDALAERLFLREKAVLEKTYLASGCWLAYCFASTWWAASALLEPSSSTTSSWCGLWRQPDWASHRFGTHALAPPPRACSWSLQGHKPNSATNSTSGFLTRFFCCWWLTCSNTLSRPWWSLEGLLAATQNWPISHQKVLVNLAACRHSCLENNRPLACCRSC